MKQNQESSPNAKQPIWETVVMAGSFALLWLWFLARQSVQKTPGNDLSPWWQAPLATAVVALLWIMARRLIRIKRAFEGKDPYGKGDEPAAPHYPGMPFPMLDGQRHGDGRKREQ